MERVDEFGGFEYDDVDPDALNVIGTDAIFTPRRSRSWVLAPELLTMLAERYQLCTEVRIVRGLNQLSVQKWMVGGGD